MLSSPRAYRRLGLAAGLALAFLLIHQVQTFFQGVEELHGPTALEPVAHEGASRIAFAADGRSLLSLDDGGSTVRWDLVTGTHAPGQLSGQGLYRGAIRQVAIDGRADLCVANAGTAAYVSNLTSRGVPWRAPGLGTGGPSPNGRYLRGSTLDERGALVFDVQTQRRLARVPSPGGARVTGVELSPDGRWLVLLCATSEGEGLWIRDLRGRETRPVAAPRPGKLWSSFTPDGRYLGLQTDAAPREFELREVGSWRTVARFLTGYGRTPVFRFSPDGSFIATPVCRSREYLVGSLGVERRGEVVETLQVFRTATGQPLLHEEAPGRVRGHGARIEDCPWSPDGTRVATLGADGRIGLWEPRQARFLRFLARG